MEKGKLENTRSKPGMYQSPLKIGCISLCLVVVGVVFYLLAKHFLQTTTETTTEWDGKSLPDDFYMGVASSAYQMEGGWNKSGRGLSIWDQMTHETPNLIADGLNGDVACDSYDKYKEDVSIVNQTGFQMYRISLSWTRIVPNGCDNITSSEGISFYHNLIDEILAYGIVPIVTLYHWDLPQSLQDYGGWTNSTTADCFLALSDIIFQEYGSKVKWWVTINELYNVITGYNSVRFAPAVVDPGVSDYQAAYNLMRAHAKVYRLYDNVYRASQQGKIGMTIYGEYYTALNESSEDDQEAAERGMRFVIGMVAHPIFSQDGDWPSVMRDNVDRNSFSEGRNVSRLPFFTTQEVEDLKGSSDFFGINHYFSRNVTSGLSSTNPSFARDSEVIYGNVATQPEGFRKLLNWVKNEYNAPQIFIMENGLNSSDVLNDTSRVNYYHDSIQAVLEAKYTDGCDIIGYTAWAIMDNFEWSHGYTWKYGIWRVDFNDTARTRTMKTSAYFFKELLANRKLPDLPFTVK